jgi:hypothetical protein
MDVLLSQVYSNEQLDDLLTNKTERPISFFDSKNVECFPGRVDKLLAIDYKNLSPG